MSASIKMIDASLAKLIEIVEVLFHIVNASNLLSAARLNADYCSSTVSDLEENMISPAVGKF